ncbi:MAG: ABC transporter substrate-binding protein [Lachnospiraceae bacterium]
MAASMCAGALSGCGGSAKDSAETTAQQSASGETTASAESSAESKPAGTLKEGGDLKIAIPQFQKTFFMPQSTSTGDWFAAQPVLEQLGRQLEDGSYEPWLAEKFETDADNLTFTITLRDGVKFSDGSDCNAEVVAWNIQQYVDNGKGSEVCNPKSIEVVDDKTVKITFDEWSNIWDSAIGSVFIASKKAYDDNGEEWCKTHAVGTGPFILDEYVTDNKVTYHKNPDYRIAGEPHIDKLEIDMMSDVNTMMSAMLNKEVGVALKFESDSIIKQLQNAGFTAIGRKTANVADIQHIIWNSKSDKHPDGRSEGSSGNHACNSVGRCSRCTFRWYR